MSSISAGTTTTTAYSVTADTTGALVLKTGASGTTAVTIDTSQNVGIGTSSPATRLSVDNTRSDTAGSGWFTYTNVAITSGRRGMRVDTSNGYWFDYYNGSSWSAQMGLDQNGNLLVGTATQATGALLTVNGSIKGTITSGTAVASTSGTAIDFTGIPSWVKRITVMLQSISTSGTSLPILRLGAGSITSSGYAYNVMQLPNGASVSGSNNGSAANFYLWSSGWNAIYDLTGAIVLTNISGNTWIMSATLGSPSATVQGAIATGSITLGGTLDRVRISTFNGTDTFDAGSINILYEG